jgi:rhomboid protease GluP
VSQLLPPDETPLTITDPGHVYQNPAWEFRERLLAVTPTVYVTYCLLAVNILVWVAMFIGGVNALKPTTENLIQWGANFGPSTVTGGQWWRLLTSMFLHIGIVHLAFNMFVLFQVGPFVERLVGNAGFFISYLVAGIAGGMTSLAWNPYVVSAGASGAIFGLYGVLLGFLVMGGRHSIPTEVLESLSKSALVFIGYNVVYGLMQAGTDMAAHAGGLIAGFLCGLVLSIPLAVETARKRRVRNAIVALGGAALIVGGSFALPRPVDLRGKLQNIAAVEKKTMETFNAIVGKARTGKFRDDEMADALEKEVLPDWVRAEQSLSDLKGLPPAQQHLASSIADYMDVRRQGWSMMAEGLRRHDPAMVRRSNALQREAQELAKKLGATPQ